MEGPLPKEIKSFPETAREERLVQIQDQLSRLGRSVWATEECGQCGVCCYKFIIPEVNKDRQYTLCENLSVDEGKAHCEIQDHKESVCGNFGCYRTFPGMPGTPIQRWQMMQMAVKVLKTKTQKDVNLVLRTPLLTRNQVGYILGCIREKNKPKLTPKQLREKQKALENLLGGL
ncbi:hypothetical protein HOA55_01700 [archaeon]|jgi:hypothetical protein|nr:hypothetical protein [archaeon]MBT3577685.1 hypothetical protein [archaeon]MBT6820048.1 hypothetical protein [archaeon]MBT6956341.1 hypothetical protein [archaeon]MBT7025351.1 hypothetical protein [archaeon]